MNTLIPSYWQRAVQELSCQDAVMKELINQYPGETLIGKNDPYLTLARAIVGQQISIKAADAIWNRLETTCGLITPKHILKEPDERLRLIGLS